MTQPDSLETNIFDFLRTIPETWIDHDPSTLSELQERAVELLTAAGMIERRVTLRMRMAGHPLAVEATVTMTGETGLAQAMEFVLRDIWNDWRDAFEEHEDGPSAHCERIGNEQWRLTAEGVIARNDLDAGNSATVFDFVLRRGFFDDRPRLMPDGNIRQRRPVPGRGALVRLRRVSSDAGPPGVVIANWEAGGAAFAAAFAELLKAKPAAAEPTTAPGIHPSFALLRVFTNGIVDERINNAAQILDDDNLTANEKLTRIDGLIHFPRPLRRNNLAKCWEFRSRRCRRRPGGESIVGATWKTRSSAAIGSTRNGPRISSRLQKRRASQSNLQRPLGSRVWGRSTANVWRLSA